MQTMVEPLDEVEFLTTSKHRVTVLQSLREAPRDRRDLRGITGASSPTMSRILIDFEQRDWLKRDGDRYRLTPLGVFVADRLVEFVDAMAVEHRLRDIWEWLPHEMDGFSIDLFSDVKITRPSPGYPDRAIERRLSLIAGASRWHGLGVAMLGLRTLHDAFERFLDQADDLTCVYIYPPTVFEEILAWGEETIHEAAQTASYTPLVHDGLPVDDRFEVCLFDDLVTICCYDDETGALQAIIETESEEARAWAERLFSRYRSEADPFDVVFDEVSSP